MYQKCDNLGVFSVFSPFFNFSELVVTVHCIEFWLSEGRNVKDLLCLLLPIALAFLLSPLWGFGIILFLRISSLKI
jgi:hypothetical protein